MKTAAFEPRLIAFAAHPDDVEILCAGTLSLLADRGWSLTICTLTGGGLGGTGTDEAATVRIREAEARQAASLIGADYRCLGGRDGFLFDSPELRLKALELIREKRAGMVVSHVSFDYHADHRAAASIADAATLLATLATVPTATPPLARTPVLYHSEPFGMTDPLGTPVIPHFCVDIGGSAARKYAMLACHRSQVELMRLVHGLDDFGADVEAQDRLWGKAAGCERAEAWWQHRGAGYPKDEILQAALADLVRLPFEEGANREP